MFAYRLLFGLFAFGTVVEQALNAPDHRHFTPKGVKIRLAQILYSGLGGHGDVAFGIIEHDDSRRFEHVLGFLGIEDLRAGYAEDCQSRDIACRNFKVEIGRPWQSWRPLYNWLVEARPDAVLLHSPTALLPCSIYAKRHGIPLLIAEHQSPSVRHAVDWGISCLAFLLADRIILITEQAVAAFRAKIGPFFQSSKVAVIPNGVDCAKGPGRSPSLAGRASINLGMAGRFVPGKRFDLALATLETLVALRPDIDWRLTLAGDGPGRKELAELRAQSSSRDRIELVGAIDRRAFPDYVGELDIYLHITAGETLSMSILQAMALGRPIVASDVVGVNAVLNETNARLVAGEDPMDFARAIISLVDHPEAALALAENARRLCEERYSAIAMSRAYRALVSDEISQARAL